MTAIWGWDLTPKPPPTRWTIGPVQPKTHQPTPGQPGTPPTNRSTVMQLTADQQVQLTISGEDRYGNPVTITGDTLWSSSDESIIAITQTAPDSATATAVGPAGTAAVTVTNDINNDGTGDYQGSLAIDVIAGEMTEIEVTPGTPTDKPVVEPH